MTSIAGMSALELAVAMKSKRLSPVEVVRHYLSAIDRLDGQLNAFVWRRDKELLAEAKAAEALLMRGEAKGSFFGVPIPIKDLSEVRGQPTTHGSVAAKDKIGRYDSAAVIRLRQAGFLFLGRTNTPEFGSIPVTENTLFGATRNPWHLAHTPGGSSGGAAAAVAAGMAPIAHASDGGGSIRIPAACCGLVGLKASRGRIPKGPWLSEIMHGFSTDGCVSTTVADTAAMLDVLSHFDPHGWYGVAKSEGAFTNAMATRLPRLRIGYTTQSQLSVPVAASATAAVRQTASMLTGLGHHVDEVQVHWPMAGAELLRDFLAVWATAGAYYDFSDWSEVEPINMQLRAIGQRQSSYDYIKAVARLQVFSRQVVQQWGETFDVLLMPTLAMEPPLIGWMHAGGDTDPEQVLLRASAMTPYTAWCNITGQPAISLPTYVAPSGLPMGIQLIGAPLREDLLLMLGAELEGVVNWQKRLPALPKGLPSA